MFAWSIGPNFDVRISPPNRVANNRYQCQTVGFGGLRPLLTRWGKFRRIAESSFCRGWTTWARASPSPIGGEFRRAKISCKSSYNRYQRQTGSGNVWPLLTRSAKFPRAAETLFCKEANTWAMRCPLRYPNFHILSLSKVWNCSKNRQKPRVNPFTFWWNFLSSKIASSTTLKCSK